MDYLVLGPLRVRAAGVERRPGAAKQRKLLGLLLAGANQVVSVDRLLEELWGDRQPAGGVRTLHYHVSKLRDWLEPDRVRGGGGVIASAAGGYVLRVGLDAIDASRFERLAEEGGRLLGEGRVRPAREVLGEALGLWEGGAFEDFRYDSFAQGVIARLEELRLVCLENRLSADLELGRHREVVGELRELTTEFPMREGLWGRLMVALYRSDQQAEALQAYQDARRVLGEELGIEPNASLRGLEEQILLHQLPFEPRRAEELPVGNLPARMASVVGRVDELSFVEKLVRERRMVTLTGLGGIGKTTLATEAARCLTGAFPDGVWLVTLAALSDPGQVLAEMAGIFDVREQPTIPLVEAVVGDLSSKSVLVVLDNCEHLIAEVAGIATMLLERCPGLRILATSREPLRIPGEQTWEVPPLDIPNFEEGVTVALARCADAVRLFLERAQESVASFELADSNVGSVVAICRRLDGIPLALEMAAARLRMLPPLQLLDRLEDRFALLTSGERTGPERHQTLQATLDWSYDLLNDREQTLLSRLAVFDGGCTLEAVEAVCAWDWIQPAEGLDLLGRLVDASLVRVEGGELVRYGMYETVREYARARLSETGDEPALRDRHAAYYSQLAAQDPDFDSPAFGSMLDTLEAERPNLRAALSWALGTGDAEAGLRLASALARQSFFHGPMIEEGLAALTQALAAGEPTPSIERADALVWFCMLNRTDLQPMRDQNSAAAHEIRRIGEALGDELVRADSLWIQHFIALDAGDRATSYQLLAERATILEQLQDPLLALTLHSMAFVSIEMGELDRAVRLADEVEQLAAALGQPQMLAHAAETHGTVAHHRGDLFRAERLLTSAVGELKRLRRIPQMQEPLLELAAATLAAGKVETAAQWTTEYLAISAGSDAIWLVFGHTMAARIALQRADLRGACREARTALHLALATDIPGRSRELLAACAQILLALGEPESAAVLLAGASRIRNSLGVQLPAPRKRELDRCDSEIRALLDPNTFRAAAKRGSSMPEDQLIACAARVLPVGDNRSA